MAFKIEIEPLTLKGEKKAETELRETPERIEKSVAELRTLLKNDPELYFSTDEEYLKMFLRPTKYYPESAYKLMKRLAEFKRDNWKLLDNCFPSVEKEFIFNTNIVNVLADRDQEHRRILLINCGSTWDPHTFPPEKMFRLLFITHQISIMENETQVAGSVIILNLQGMGFKQAKAFSPTFSYKLLHFLQDAMPARIKEIHIVLQPMVFKIVWQVFKPFIREKLRTRIHFHGSDFSTLHKLLDPSILPSDFGGKKPKLNYTCASWYPAIEDQEPVLREWATYGYKKK